MIANECPQMAQPSRLWAFLFKKSVTHQGRSPWFPIKEGWFFPCIFEKIFTITHYIISQLFLIAIVIITKHHCVYKPLFLSNLIIRRPYEL